MDAADVVAEYLVAFSSGQVERAASLVSSDFSLRTPMQTFEGPKELEVLLAHLAPGIRGFQLLRQWADAGEVSSLYQLVGELPSGPVSFTISQWDSVRDGKVRSSLMIFDTGVFPGDRPAVPDHDVDPVCHMTIDRTSAPAQRRYGDHDYFFCSIACSDLFDMKPERYMTGADTA